MLRALLLLGLCQNQLFVPYLKLSQQIPQTEEGGWYKGMSQDFLLLRLGLGGILEYWSCHKFETL